MNLARDAGVIIKPMAQAMGKNTTGKNYEPRRGEIPLKFEGSPGCRPCRGLGVVVFSRESFLANF